MTALVLELLALGVAFGFTYLLGHTIGDVPWLVGPAAAVLGGTARTVAEATTEGGAGRPRGEVGPGGRPPAPGGRGVSTVSALLVVLVIFGGGGYAVVTGGRYLAGWLTGDEPQVGLQRLISSGVGTNRRVSARVTGLVNTAHFTRVEVAVTNSEALPATIVRHGIQIIGGSTTIPADDFKGAWPDPMPQGLATKGVLIFPGHLSDSATTVALSFSTIFLPDPTFRGERGLRIPDVKLRALT